jgi:polyisoprenoid-binding protein YceI
MKKQIVNLAVASFIVLGAVSCKEKESDTNVSEVKEAAESTVTASNFNVDTEKSVIKWKGSKPGKEHTGTIKLNSGTVAAEARDIQSGSFVIDMNTISNSDLEGDSKANLEAHLKGTVAEKKTDFFNVTEHPTGNFEITSVTGTGGYITVAGNLKIKDITQPVEFPAVVSFPGDQIFLKSEPFIIDRTKWEINFKSKSVFDDLKDKFISDDVELTIELHGTKA